MATQADINAAIAAMQQARATFGRMEVVAATRTITDDGFDCRVDANMRNSLDAIRALDIAIAQLGGDAVGRRLA